MKNNLKIFEKGQSINGYYIDIDAIFSYCFSNQHDNKQREIADTYEYDEDGSLVPIQKVAHEVTMPNYENGISNEKLKLINYLITVVFEYNESVNQNKFAYEMARNTLEYNGIIKKK